MRRRIVQATVAAVTLAVLLVGVPMAVFGVMMVWDSQIRDLGARAEALGRAVDQRLYSSEQLDGDMLAPFTGQQYGPSAYVEVDVPGEKPLTGGSKPTGPVETTTLNTPGGATITVEVSWWALVWKCAVVVILVLGASGVAFAAGIVLANWQASKLAAPLVYLAASAEQLGAGQTRPRLEASGVEEIDLVAAELTRSAERMASRLALERQFASDASHQLRTPLTALTMRLEEIEVLAESEDVREEARISLEQVSRLVQVIDDLLVRNRTNTGGSTEPLHVVDVVRRQQDEWEPAYEKAGRTLATDIPSELMVLATPGGLAQVLATLIENSLKHGDGTTTVRARPGGKSPSGAGSTIVIEVTDEGPGIPDEMAGNVFERNVTSGHGGTGLGLALARDLVAADGGRLELAQRHPPVFQVFLSGVPTRLDPSQVLPHGARVSTTGRRVRRRRRAGNHQPK